MLGSNDVPLNVVSCRKMLALSTSDKVLAIFCEIEISKFYSNGS